MHDPLIASIDFEVARETLNDVMAITLEQLRVEEGCLAPDLGRIEILEAELAARNLELHFLSPDDLTRVAEIIQVGGALVRKYNESVGGSGAVH